MNIILSIAAGGALGAVLRHMITLMGTGLTTAFPFATLIINILGSFLLGCAVIGLAQFVNLSEAWKAFIIIGMLGSFTTFSTFSMDVFELWSRNDYIGAFTYASLSVILSIGGLVLGMMVMKQIVA